MAATKNADDMSSVTVSAQRMGDILGVGDRMVRYLAEEGVLKRNSHGKYLLVASVKNYILTLKISKPTSAETEKNEGPLSWEDEKAKHEKLKRQITDLKLQVLKGHLHKSEDVERVVNDMLGTASGAYFANKKTTALVAYRLEQLEKKQDVHNQVIDRVYKLEKSVALNSEDIKVANHRIQDLEKKG